MNRANWDERGCTVKPPPGRREIFGTNFMKTITESGQLFELQQRIQRKVKACSALELVTRSLDREALSYAAKAIRLRREIRRLKRAAFRARVQQFFQGSPVFTK